MKRTLGAVMPTPALRRRSSSTLVGSLIHGGASNMHKKSGQCWVSSVTADKHKIPFHLKAGHIISPPLVSVSFRTSHQIRTAYLGVGGPQYILSRNIFFSTHQLVSRCVAGSVTTAERASWGPRRSDQPENRLGRAPELGLALCIGDNRLVGHGPIGLATGVGIRGSGIRGLHGLIFLAKPLAWRKILGCIHMSISILHYLEH